MFAVGMTPVSPTGVCTRNGFVVADVNKWSAVVEYLIQFFSAMNWLISTITSHIFDVDE